jgi:hypothetical protein
MSGSETDELEVEAILECRKFGKTTKYLVKWMGYDSTENTWEPRSNLLGAKALLDRFHRESSELRNAKGFGEKKVEEIVGCKRSRSKGFFYSVRFAGESEICEVRSAVLEAHDREAMLDYLEGLIPRK